MPRTTIKSNFGLYEKVKCYTSSYRRWRWQATAAVFRATSKRNTSILAQTIYQIFIGPTINTERKKKPFHLSDQQLTRVYVEHFMVDCVCVWTVDDLLLNAIKSAKKTQSF